MTLLNFGILTLFLLSGVNLEENVAEITAEQEYWDDNVSVYWFHVVPRIIEVLIVFARFKILKGLSSKI